MRTIPLILISSLLCAALAVSCGTDSVGGADEESTGGLPADHPPVAPAQGPGELIAPPPQGSGAGAAGLAWETPPDWIPETPSSAMRRAQYRVPGPGGEGELVVFYFGPGQGGDAMANALRWAGQFAQPGGGSSEEVLKTERIQVGDVSVLLVEVTGTYSGGMMTGPPQELADHMLLGAIAEGGDANWFFKLTGPETTVSARREGFRAMIESLRRGG